MQLSILQRRKIKAATLAAALTAPIAGFEGASKGNAINVGDVVINQVGNGATLSSQSTPVTLLDFTPVVSANGTVSLTAGSTIPIPSSGVGQNPLTVSGTATSEGFLSVSPDGSNVVLTGYDTTPGLASVTSSNSTTVPREVGLVNTATGAVDTSTTTTAFGGNNIRSAAFDGTTVYASGATSPGVTALTPDVADTSGGVPLQNTVTNDRQVEIYNGNLYVSDQTGSAFRLYGISGFNGTANSGAATELPGLNASNNTSANAGTRVLGNPYGFAFANNGNTLYVADQGSGNNTANNPTVSGGIYKYVLTAGTYQADGSVLNNSIQSVTVETLTNPSNNATFNAIFYTVPSNVHEISDYGTSLTGLTDNGGLATAATNDNFRGDVAVVPEPATLTVLAIGSGAALLRRRRRSQRPPRE